MRSALPDLSAPLWTSKLAGLFERTSLAIGRLDARFSAAPAASAWASRAAWAGFAEARRGQGVEIDEIDVFALACGIMLPGRRPIAFAADEAHSLAAWRKDLARRDARHWRELVPISIDLPEDWGERPALLRALELISRHARTESTTAPWLASPILLAALGATKAPLPCLVIADKALRLAPRDRDAIIPRYLKQLARAAEIGLDRLQALETDRLRAAEVISRLTRPGKLVALTALLQHRPLISPVGAARALRLTPSGAGKLLARAAEANLAVEISGRFAWKMYMTPDLAASFGYVSRPVGRPPALPEIAPLDAVLAQFDAEMASIDARLLKLGER